MKLTGNVILITGGATGIGFALAESFVRLGNEVIICGRRKSKLDEAKKKLTNIHTIRCDISKDQDRRLLYRRVIKNFKQLDILVNNAGIQRQIDFKKGMTDLKGKDDEIVINFKAQVELAAQFIPLLIKNKDEAAIVNVSSGLAFVPLAIYPVYCATKAAIHSFSMSLRHQLKDTPVKVFEVVPPMVHDTELKGRPVQKSEISVSASEVAKAVTEGLKNNEYEIAVGTTKNWVATAKRDFGQAFLNINT